jgi:hypothetical protein
MRPARLLQLILPDAWICREVGEKGRRPAPPGLFATENRGHSADFVESLHPAVRESLSRDAARAKNLIGSLQRCAQSREDIMKTSLSRLLVRAPLVAAVTLFASACTQSSPMPSSPSPVTAIGNAATDARAGHKLSIELRSHSDASPYVIGQLVVVIEPDGTTQGVVTTAPHGDADFTVQTADTWVEIIVEKDGYCRIDDHHLTAGRTPIYIWLMPADGNHGCSAV